MKQHQYIRGAPIPADEGERLAALTKLRVLDSTPEQEFDDIAQLAAEICGTPIALVSLIDAERQWFKSRVGLEACETHRDVAFCAHAILSDALFEVPDATRDPRFADNPLVINEPRIRFYAGAPLQLSSGHRIGTLCVIDQVARQLTESQRRNLVRLARLTVANLDARRQRLEAEDQERLLFQILEAMPDALVACDASGKLSLFNAVARAWHGVDPRWVPPERWAEHFGLYLPDGQTLLPPEQIPLRRAYLGELVEDQEIRIKAQGQPARSLLCSGAAFDNEQGQRAGALVVMRDITERLAAEQAIAEARGYLQAVIDASLDVAMIATDAAGTITLFNSGAERLLGYTAAELVGKCTPALFHLPAEVLQRGLELSAEYGRLIDGFDVFVAKARDGVGETRQWTYVSKEGRHCPVRLSVSAITDATGKPAGFLGMAIDLSSQRKAEASALMNEQRFSGAFQSAAQGMALVSIEGRFLEVNDAVCTILGYSRDELLNMDFQQLTVSDDLAPDLELMQQLLRGDIPNYQIRKRYLKRDGRKVTTTLSVSLVRDSDGQPLHFVSQIMDVTDQVLAEQAVLEGAHYVDSLLKSVADGIVSTDGDGHVLATNRAMCVLLDRSENELIGSRLIDVFSRPSKALLRERLALRRLQPEARGFIERMKLQVLRRDGVEIPVELAVSALQRGGEQHLVCLFHDLREQERVEQLKRNFVSTVSHELRTPLTAISGTLRLLLSDVLGILPPRQRELLTVTERNCERLAHLIDDLLDFEKLSAGRMQVDVTREHLAPLLAELHNQHRGYAERMKVEVRLINAAQCDVMIDRHRFAQVLANLLSNACKFSPQGGQVELTSSIEPGFARIEVRDHGSGIPEQFRARVFERFSQADSSDRRGQPGTGLGLAICRELVQLMKGDIGFDSETGKGTLFWFRVPIADDTPSTSTQAIN